MNDRLRILGVGILVVGLGTGQALLACGDKFLMPSRGTQFDRAPRSQAAAAILLYANPASALPRALANLPVESLLQRAGHRVTIVSRANDFERALRQQGWDLIIVDAADGSAVGQTVPTTAILPVVFNPTHDEMATVSRLYPIVIKAPIKNQRLLSVIDEALELRAKRLKTAGRKAAN